MSAGAPFTVLVVDDHPLFRKGAAQLLEMDRDFLLVGEAASGPQGVQMAARLEPDLILLDLDMKGMNGIETLLSLKRSGIDALFVVLTVSNEQEDLVAALRAGADGYLLKDMEPEQLLLKLRQAAKGEVVLDDSMTPLLAHAFRHEQQSPAPTEVSLTDREHEILHHISAGMSNKMIARALDISEGTVKVHVKNLLRKLNLRSRLEAAVWALERGGAR